MEIEDLISTLSFNSTLFNSTLFNLILPCFYPTLLILPCFNSTLSFNSRFDF